MSRPVKTSTVETMGRALRGTFVRGIMAMNILMMIESIRGYPLVLSKLAVISVITLSPNMRIPATAVAQSRM